MPLHVILMFKDIYFSPSLGPQRPTIGQGVPVLRPRNLPRSGGKPDMLVFNTVPSEGQAGSGDQVPRDILPKQAFHLMRRSSGEMRPEDLKEVELRDH